MRLAGRFRFRSRGFSVLLIGGLLVPVALLVPAMREPTGIATARVCRNTLAITARSLQTPNLYRSLADHAQAAAIAIIAVELYNRPALMRTFEEFIFDLFAEFVPLVDRMTLGPAQISRVFFDSEVAPLMPGSQFPEAILKLAGTQRALTIWATARLSANYATFSLASPQEQQEALAGLFDAFHGAKDPTYRTAALHVALGRCSASTKRPTRHRHQYAQN